jgi:hypothetical protein
VIVGVPTSPGVYVTEQLSLVAPAGDSVQLLPDPKVPVSDDEKDTDPAGCEGVPLSLSETVAVQVVEWETAVDGGEQDTAVAVARVVTETCSAPLLAAHPGSEPPPG